MVYKNGIVSNSHQLAQIIHAVMREAGWTLRSGLELDGTDSVFYSDGEDGNQDIYIRVAAKQSDIIATGDIQFPASDGYTGFVNFFAYQFFPNSGVVGDGLSEIGRFGPIMYLMDDPDSSSNRRIEEYNMYSSTSGTGRRRVLREGLNSNSGDLGETFDGHRFMWIKPDGSSTISYIDMSREQGEVFSSNRNGSFFQNVNTFGTNFVISRKSNSELLLWTMKNSTNAGLATFDSITEQTVDVAQAASVYALPPWGTTSSAGSGGWLVQGTRRNGKKYLYVGRGDDSTTWARYDIEDNSWDTMSPSMPIDIDSGAHAILIPKEGSGYSTDRLYVIRGENDTEFFSIAIDDSGDPTGSWTFHDNTPFSITTSPSGRLVYVGGDRIFLVRGESNDFYSWQFPTPATDNGTWASNNNWFAETNENQVTVGAHNHLSCRAHVNEFEGSKYWVFADKDRVIVITQTERSEVTDDYHFAYAGLFESFAGSTEKANLVSTASSGTSTLEVDDASLFKEGVQYRLAQIDDSNSTTHTAFNGQERKIAHAEFVTISSVNQHSVSPAQLQLSSPLKHTYNSGAKIGEEMQPVCLSVDDMNRVMVLNNINTDADDINNDPPYQWYTYKRPQLSMRTSADRVGGTSTWPVLLAHSGTSDNVTVTSKDARGRLKGVFYTSGVVGNEETLDIGGDRYVSFSVFETVLMGRIAVGPVE